ncbi:MAG: cysteinyl-tRNA synthetase [Anaerolineales bacterium]|nr:cysteinyl-tRNA synthetase [Anaerolineales bacterium]
MALRLYNTLSRKTEPFEPLEPGRVRMYVCGPTVYAQAHIGHAMSTVVFDVIRRFLEYRGYQVQHVMNYTDVEDKIIRRAAELGVAPEELARQHQRAFERHLQDLNVEMPSMRPQASQEIPTIIEMIERLIAAGYAYPVEGDVYFRVSRARDYGRLSGRRLEDMRAGARLDVDERKEDPADFALWKAAKPGEPSWSSPWGTGRPGWHIECSAMNLRYLGEQIDLHGGGNDLVFPHHENEIAQTESLTGKPFARYWVHNGMLQLKGEKMSKSLGNLVTVEAFLAEHEADAFRMMVLNSHYRGPLTYTDEVAGQAQAALERLRSGLRPARPRDDAIAAAAQALSGEAEAAQRRFIEAMEDDFNTPSALAALFDLVRAINQARDAGLSAEELAAGQTVLRELAGVLGLRLDLRRETSGDSAPYIQLLVEVRDELRKARQWELADRIRDRLAEAGISVEDDPAGTRWERR